MPHYLDPFACTHVIYAFATIDPHSFKVEPRDEEFDIVQGGYRSAVGLKRKNPTLKVLISIGGIRGESSHRFSSLVSSANKRRDFIRSVIAFVREHGFDGVDLHWQYPGAEELGGRASDKEHFAALLEELSDIFKQRGWLLSVAVPASRFTIEDGFDPDVLAQTADFINLQAYDFHRDREGVTSLHGNLYKQPGENGLDVYFTAVSKCFQFRIITRL